MKNPIPIKTLGILLMALPFSANATQIFYDSFESPTVATAESGTDPDGWADLSTNVDRAGLGNIASSYTNEVGNQAAFLRIYNATPKLETTTAILDETLAANTRYELRYNAASSSSSYTVYADLYAGTTLVMSATVSPGNSKNFALGAAEAIHIVTPGDPGIGGALKIVLRETHTGNPWNQPLYIDELTLDAIDTTLDNTAPTPDPMTWVDLPTPAGNDGMLMTVSTATDDNFVEYYFENKTMPSHNSGWIETTTWKDTGLADGVTYTYRVKARDKSPNQNETAWSPEHSATANTDVLFYDSFESPLVDGTATGTDPSGWDDASTQGNRAGLGDLNGAGYPNLKGDQAAWLNVYNANPILETTTAILDETLAENTNYYLRFDAASTTTNYTVYADLYAGTTLVMTASRTLGNSKNFANGAAEEIHLVLPGDDGIGEPLKIVLRVTGGAWNQQAYVDNLQLVGESTANDFTPPTPDPMTWVDVPTPAGDNGMLMTASTATDTNFVEYYFENKTLPSHNSGWIDETTWQDTGLTDGVTYEYRVKARDKSPNHNETAWSPVQSATADSDVIFYDSFESPLVDSNRIGTDPAGWADLSTGTLNSSRAGLGDLNGSSPTYSNVKGDQAAWLNVYNSDPILETTTAILNKPLAANTNYTLSFNAASSSNDYTLHADLYAGTTLVMTASERPLNSRDFANGAAQAIQFVPCGAAAVGEPLKIVLRVTYTGYPWNQESYLDNLKLEAETVPTTLLSIERNQPSPSKDPDVSWLVTFDCSVGGLSGDNFSLDSTGVSVSGGISVSPGESPEEYVVTANGVSGCGTLKLVYANNDGLSSPLTNTLPYEDGEAYEIDTVGPVIECARDIVVSIPAGETTDPVNYETTVSDDCSGLDTLEFSPPSGSTFTVGVHPVTATATDNAGNESTATFNVVVLAIAETPGGRFIDASVVSGDAAAGADVPEGATFSNIYNAYLNNGGEVLFSADLEGGTTGVFSGGSTTGPFTAIAVQGAESGVGAYGKFSDLTLNDAGDTGFASRLSSGPAHFANATPSAVQGGVAAATGGGEIYRSLQKPALSSGGVLMTRANLVLGSGAGVTVFDDTVITGSDDSLLAREGDPTSIGGGVLYSGLDSRVVASEDNNHYAFSANLKPGSSRTNSAVFADVVGAGTPAVFVREGDAAPGTGGGVFDTFRAEAVNSNGDVALRGTARDAGITSADSEAIWTDAGGSLELVAREGDDIPCLPPGLDGLVAFDRFETLAIADDGSVCFFAYLRNATTAQAVNSTNDGSIWRWEDGELYLIAREGDAANNTNGAAIGRLDAFACSGTGGVVYQVEYVANQGDTTSANRDGIYLDRGDGDAAPELVLRRGDSFDFRGEARTVNGLDISTEENAGGGTGGYGRAINDAGDILLNLSISGNLNGIFVLSEAPPLLAAE